LSRLVRPRLRVTYLADQIVQLFKMRIQRIFTKIAYAVYLTQFPIFFYNVGKVRNAEYFEFIKIMVSAHWVNFLSFVNSNEIILTLFSQYNVEEFTSIMLCSLALHLFIEAPFNNLRKLIFDKKQPPVAVKKIE
jgi:hypothetical protein